VRIRGRDLVLEVLNLSVLLPQLKFDIFENTPYVDGLVLMF
jgi:hypothetical protein